VRILNGSELNKRIFLLSAEAQLATTGSGTQPLRLEPTNRGFALGYLIRT
jgi:hypothetical protein